ncbi:MAG TPA: BamA/TamA family outer membrane protein, partial [Chitinophagaceae bacterium]
RKNNKVITTRGIHMDLYGRPMINIAGSSENLTQVGGILSLYTDLLMKDRIILATSFGADHNIGDFHIPQAHYLGFRQNLRGYLFQRFAGRTRAYNNTELRMNLGNVNLYLAKGPFGIFGFHDMARVWVDDETSDTWHKGYGGGVWMAPFNKIVVTAAVTSSKEEKLVPLMSFGFQF